MRYLYIAVVMAFIASGSAFAADEAGRCATQAQAKEPAHEAVQSGEAPIEVDYNDKRSDDKEFGVGNEREMPQNETRDPNTGMPNVVPSDKEGEI